MEEAIEKPQIPADIVTEILHHLPLKSLARFMCVSNLWYNLATLVISERLINETSLRMLKFVEIQPSFQALYEEKQEFEGVDELRSHSARLKAKLDVLLSILRLDDDMNRCVKVVPGMVRERVNELRDCSVHVVRWGEKVFGRMDAMIRAGEAVQQVLDA